MDEALWALGRGTDASAPLVREMDEAGVFRKDLLREFFELGLMGIEVPEPMGGAGGSFFDAALAIEAISSVDPAVGVLVDVHNTLVVNAIRRWASEDQRVESIVLNIVKSRPFQMRQAEAKSTVTKPALVSGTETPLDRKRRAEIGQNTAGQ